MRPLNHRALTPGGPRPKKAKPRIVPEALHRLLARVLLPRGLSTFVDNIRLWDQGPKADISWSQSGHLFGSFHRARSEWHIKYGLSVRVEGAFTAILLTVPMPQSALAIAVFCASSLGNHKAFQAAALSLGYALATEGRPLVYGCGSEGIMGVVSGATLQKGGHVIGVVPRAMVAAGGEVAQGQGCIADETVLQALTTKEREKVEMVIVDSMNDRKAEMERLASAFVALPGGIGTIEEIMDAMTMAQVGFHNKPIILLNVLSYFNPLREMIRNGVRDGFIYPQNEKLIQFVDGPTDHLQHETFDWGSAALRVIGNWESVARLGQYDWSACGNKSSAKAL